jgi:hypothetical protein
LVVTVRQRERVFAMGGSKLNPFATCARPHSGHLHLAAHITDGADNHEVYSHLKGRTRLRADNFVPKAHSSGEIGQ